MDAQVEKALAKWPNVPHCYGWLSLDARGIWRMRDEHAQKNNLPGDKITQPALIGFINRNYIQDDRGQWYFQNGPQRVYVDLEAAPYIAHTEPHAGFVTQTGERLQAINAAWLSDQGRLWLQGDGKIALLDDRDLAQCLALIHSAGHVINDEQLLIWLSRSGASEELTLKWDTYAITVGHIEEARIEAQFGFIRLPRGTS
jgi:hypothetical protein